jgi:hypothetical protein
MANTHVAIRSMLRKLGKDGQRLHLTYEAGPLGYNLYRLATKLCHRCDVVAPSLIPRKAGDKIKTDRRDAMMLAQLLRAGQLTEVWVPDEAHEAMRDLVRMRAQAMKDLRKTRHRQQPRAHVPRRSGVDQSASGARYKDHPRQPRRAAGADPSYRLEGTGPIIGALSQADGCRQPAPKAIVALLGNSSASPGPSPGSSSRKPRLWARRKPSDAHRDKRPMVCCETLGCRCRQRRLRIYARCSVAQRLERHHP